MTQLTIRRLDKVVIDGLKKRAAAAGHSMEEEARRILSEAVVEAGIARQRAGLRKLLATRKEIFGDKLFPDSSEEFRKMRDERTRVNASWLSAPNKK